MDLKMFVAYPIKYYLSWVYDKYLVYDKPRPYMSSNIGLTLIGANLGLLGTNLLLARSRPSTWA